MRGTNLFLLESKDNIDGDEFSYAKGKTSAKKKAPGKLKTALKAGAKKAIAAGKTALNKQLATKPSPKPQTPAEKPAPEAPAPPPSDPKPKGMSTGKKVGIGVGIVLVVATVIVVAVKASKKKGK